MAQQISQSICANYVHSGPKALGKPKGLQPILRYSEEKVRDVCRAIKLSY